MPTGVGTRPTSDRAREGLFSSLQSLVDVAGSRVLDLYAGSGALGLEALSRGAAEAVLVESDPTALEVVRGNAVALGLPARVVAADVPRFLAGPPSPYDLVLLDPPYALDADPVLAALAGWVGEEGVVVLERGTRSRPPTWPPDLREVRARRYGETVLRYASRS